jgi:hypothetical protein
MKGVGSGKLHAWFFSKTKRKMASKVNIADKQNKGLPFLQ